MSLLRSLLLAWLRLAAVYCAAAGGAGAAGTGLRTALSTATELRRQPPFEALLGASRWRKDRKEAAGAWCGDFEFALVCKCSSKSSHPRLPRTRATGRGGDDGLKVPMGKAAVGEWPSLASGRACCVSVPVLVRSTTVLHQVTWLPGCSFVPGSYLHVLFMRPTLADCPRASTLRDPCRAPSLARPAG